MARHIHDASLVALELWRMGAAVICPGKNTFLFDGALKREAWLKGDLEIIDRCDAVVLAPGWHDSEGATAEYAHACDRSIPVFDWETDRERLAQFLAEPNVLKLAESPEVQRIVAQEKESYRP